jgi:hypothetical protein
VLQDFHAWNFYLHGIYAYESKDVTIDGYVARGSLAGSKSTNGLFMQDYYAVNFVLSHADIRGLNVGVRVTTDTGGSALTIRDSTFQDATDVYVQTPWTSAYSCQWEHPREVDLNNDTFLALPGMALMAVDMEYAPQGSNLIMNDLVFIHSYNGVAGADFQVYYNEQVGSFVLPKSTYNSDGSPILLGSPEAGLSNQQNWVKYGFALAGAVAPTSATAQAGFHGLVRHL